MIASLRLMLGLFALAAGLSGVPLAFRGQQGPAQAGGDRGARASWTLAPAPEETKVILRRMREKTEVIEELLRGELTLLEAAAWFRFLNDNPPDCPCPFREQFPGRSDGEKACRSVLRWLTTTVCDRGEQKPSSEVLARLQTELDALLTERAAVDLPW
jgi:hypothetical protein